MIREPFFNSKGLRAVSGCVVLEDGDKIWIVKPTDELKGPRWVFPKGLIRSDLSSQSNAIQKTLEVAGIPVEIEAYLTDVFGEEFVTRYYLAKRTGELADFYWGTHERRLVTMKEAQSLLTFDRDQKAVRNLALYLLANMEI